MQDYTYVLAEAQIARYPLPDRAAARLLVARGGNLSHHHVHELPHMLVPGTVCVMNDTRVMPVRLHMQRATGGMIEVFCLEWVAGPGAGTDAGQAWQQQGTAVWRCLIGGGRRWRTEEALHLQQDGVTLQSTRAGTDDQGPLVRFSWQPAVLSWAEVLHRVGHVPLPPYLGRADEPTDAENYQTVYAQRPGAVAAPTAGLHFTPEVLNQLCARGMVTEQVTLHVGAGTFLPVTAAHATEHQLHTEQMEVPLRTVQTLAEAQGPIMAVGTTSLRTLESLYWLGTARLMGIWGQQLPQERWFPANFPYRTRADLPTRAEAMAALVTYAHEADLHALTGGTGLYVMPGYRTQMVDILMTNFHQPGSTLLLLVAAFLGEQWREVYAEALRQDYRFLSYGDSSLLWRGV